MKLFDLNILISAHREDQQDHAYFRKRLLDTLQESTGGALSPLVAVGFVRVVTHSKFHLGPTPLPIALAFIDGLLADENCHWITPGRKHWQIASDLCRRANARGKLVADAQHAAIAIENACTFVSRDSDFAKFAPHGLRWEHWIAV